MQKKKRLKHVLVFLYYIQCCFLLVKSSRGIQLRTSLVMFFNIEGWYSAFNVKLSSAELSRAPTVAVIFSYPESSQHCVAPSIFSLVLSHLSSPIWICHNTAGRYTARSISCCLRDTSTHLSGVEMTILWTEGNILPPETRQWLQFEKPLFWDKSSCYFRGPLRPDNPSSIKYQKYSISSYL